MQVTEREAWLLNFYRNSELHGALFMGKLARNVADTDLLVHLTEHCATEAHHAALLTETIAALGIKLDPRTETIQNHYGAEGGIPKELVDLLVLSETLEKRVLASYRAHLERDDVHPHVRAVLERIVHEMETEEEGEHAGWIDNVLEAQPRQLVDAAEAKWRGIDERVASALHAGLAARFS
jgi:bacterioferritin (cytochrome b1)